MAFDVEMPVLAILYIAERSRLLCNLGFQEVFRRVVAVDIEIP